MAEVEEKPKEVQDAGDSGAGKSTTAEVDDREFKSVEDARRAEADKNDPKKAVETMTREAKEGAHSECCKAIGDGKAIANNDAVKKDIEANKTKDPSAKVDKDGISFNNNVLGGTGLEGIAGKSGDKIAMARSLNVGDQKFEAASGKGAEKGKPGDNNVRDIDPSKDNPEAVQQRYNQMVDGLGLPPAEAARMKEQYGKDLAKVQEKYKGDDLAHIMRANNLMMDQNNHLGNDRNRVNATSGLMARGADPEIANRQGANPTCALTSQSRIEQQRDFVKYADQMGSVAARGGAWRGGANGTEATWVDVNPAGTNNANFIADGEASRMYNPNYHQKEGHRDYLGQLDNAVVGGEMAKYAGEKAGKDYVYVAANANRVNGSDAFGQGASGNTLMTRDANGNLTQARDGGRAVDSPPSTLDMVAQVNHANGGGGMFIQENLAAQFRRQDGSYPPGMNVFRDAADLRQQLSSAENKGKEFQIATNGVIVAGREGHGLHAQTVKVNADGKLEFGNNWSDKDNKRADYSDAFINKFTNPKEWNNYQPSHVRPDGSPDWEKERVGPRTSDVVKPDSSQDKDKEKKDKDAKEEEDKKKEAKNKSDKEEEDRKQADKQKAMQKAQADFEQDHKEWEGRKADWEAKNKDNKDAGSFSEAEPVFKPGF